MSFGHRYHPKGGWFGDECRACGGWPTNSAHWHEFKPKLLQPQTCVRCGNPAESRWHGTKEKEAMSAEQYPSEVSAEQVQESRSSMELTCDELQKLLGAGFEVMETPDENRPLSRIRLTTADSEFPSYLVWSVEFTDLVVDAIRQNPGCDRIQMIQALAKADLEKRTNLSARPEATAPWPETNNSSSTESRAKSPAERLEDLTEWWMTTSASDLEMVAKKAVTYGSNSLEQLGRKMAQLQGAEVTDEEAQELGCWVNAVQKMERWTDAVMRGERPQDDTLLDLMVYATMARRIRHSGGWPDGQR